MILTIMDNKTFKIFNNTFIQFGWKDKLRILFGREVKVSVTIHVNKEVEVFGNKTEYYVYVKPIRIKKTTLLQAPE